MSSENLQFVATLDSTQFKSSLQTMSNDIEKTGDQAQKTTTKMQTMSKVDFTKLAMGVTGLATSATSAFIAFDNLQDMQIKVAQASLRVSKAQEEVNKLQQEGKTGTLDYEQAVQRLSIAQAKHKDTVEQVDQMTVQFALNLTTMATATIPMGIKSIMDITKSLGGFSTAMKILQGSMGKILLVATGVILAFEGIAHLIKYFSGGEIDITIENLGAKLTEAIMGSSDASQSFVDKMPEVQTGLKDMGDSAEESSTQIRGLNTNLKENTVILTDNTKAKKENEKQTAKNTEVNKKYRETVWRQDYISKHGYNPDESVPPSFYKKKADFTLADHHAEAKWWRENTNYQAYKAEQKRIDKANKERLEKLRSTVKSEGYVMVEDENGVITAVPKANFDETGEKIKNITMKKTIYKIGGKQIDPFTTPADSRDQKGKSIMYGSDLKASINAKSFALMNNYRAMVNQSYANTLANTAQKTFARNATFQGKTVSSANPNYGKPSTKKGRASGIVNQGKFFSEKVRDLISGQIVQDEFGNIVNIPSLPEAMMRNAQGGSSLGHTRSGILGNLSSMRKGWLGTAMDLSKFGLLQNIPEYRRGENRGEWKDTPYMRAYSSLMSEYGRRSNLRGANRQEIIRRIREIENLYGYDTIDEEKMIPIIENMFPYNSLQGIESLAENTSQFINTVIQDQILGKARSDYFTKAGLDISGYDMTNPEDFRDMQNKLAFQNKVAFMSVGTVL